MIAVVAWGKGNGYNGLLEYISMGKIFQSVVCGIMMKRWNRLLFLRGIGYPVRDGVSFFLNRRMLCQNEK